MKRLFKCFFLTIRGLKICPAGNYHKIRDRFCYCKMDEKGIYVFRGGKYILTGNSGEG